MTSVSTYRTELTALKESLILMLSAGTGQDKVEQEERLLEEESSKIQAETAKLKKVGSASLTTHNGLL